MVQQHPYIVVAGVMGSGKTTIARILGEALGAHVFEEEFEDNAFLERFYQDMARWALHCQLYFFSRKIKQALLVKELLRRTPVVQDAPAGSDVYIYAKTLNALGHLHDQELSLLEDLFQLYEPQLPRPDLYILVRISDELLAERIRERARSFEQGVTQEYLRGQKASFDEWAARFPKERVFENRAAHSS